MNGAYGSFAQKAIFVPLGGCAQATRVNLPGWPSCLHRRMVSIGRACSHSRSGSIPE